MNQSVFLPSRGWLIAGGILSILGGFFAITFPLIASIAVTQLIGALALLTGLFEFFPALLMLDPRSLAEHGKGPAAPPQ